MLYYNIEMSDDDKKGILVYPEVKRIDEITKYNSSISEKIANDLKVNQKNEEMDEVTMLILEKQIGIINFIKKLNDNYDKVIKRIEKDKKAGKKTTLKKMKKVTIDEKKKKKKKKKKSSSSSSSSSSEDEKPKKKQSDEIKKKKTTTKKKDENK